MPRESVEALMVISSPRIDPWTSCVPILTYHGAVNVVAESELLVGEAAIAKRGS
jgi:hypothetical protein